jgi:hypothetical protein
MGTKTISLRDEAYDRLKRAKRSPSESFSEVVMRAVWPDLAISAEAYLRMVRERGAVYSRPQLDRIDEVSAEDRPPGEKWPKG